MKFLKRVRYLWRISQIERELTEEMDLHRRMSGEPAMGDIDQALREAAGVWRWPWLDGLGRLRSVPRWFARRFWKLPDRAASFIEGLGSITFFAVLFGWRWLTGTDLTTRTALWLAAFYIICSLLQAVVGGFVQGVLGAVLGAKDKPKREFVEDPDAVLELSKLAGYESIRPFNRYLGKWMTVTGEFEGASEALDAEAIHVSVMLDDSRRLILRFDREQRGSLEPLQPRQRITVIGEIDRVSFELRPQHCELVRIEPLRAKPRLTLAS